MHVDATGSLNQMMDVRQPVRSLPAKSQPPVKPTAGELSTTTAAGSPVCGTPSQMPTIEELMKAWGSSDAMCDLNADGTVDVSDLLALINQMASQMQQPPTEPDAVLTTGATQDDSALTAAIDPSSTPPLSPSDPSIPQDPSAVLTSAAAPLTTDVAPPSNAQPAPTLQGILDSWGQNDATHDLNGDGTVDVQDLLQFINNNSPGGSPAAHARAAEVSRARLALATRAFGGNAADHSMAGVSKLTNSLIDALSVSGFKHQPPTNLHELVDKLNLEPKQSDYVMKKLEQQYPRGLGVNAVA